MMFTWRQFGFWLGSVLRAFLRGSGLSEQDWLEKSEEELLEKLPCYGLSWEPGDEFCRDCYVKPRCAVQVARKTIPEVAAYWGIPVDQVLVRENQEISELIKVSADTVGHLKKVFRDPTTPYPEVDEHGRFVVSSQFTAGEETMDLVKEEQMELPMDDDDKEELDNVVHLKQEEPVNEEEDDEEYDEEEDDEEEEPEDVDSDEGDEDVEGFDDSEDTEASEGEDEEEPDEDEDDDDEEEDDEEDESDEGEEALQQEEEEKMVAAQYTRNKDELVDLLEDLTAQGKKRVSKLLLGLLGNTVAERMRNASVTTTDAPKRRGRPPKVAKAPAQPTGKKRGRGKAIDPEKAYARFVAEKDRYPRLAKMKPGQAIQTTYQPRGASAPETYTAILAKHGWEYEGRLFSTLSALQKTVIKSKSQQGVKQFWKLDQEASAPPKRRGRPPKAAKEPTKKATNKKRTKAAPKASAPKKRGVKKTTKNKSTGLRYSA